MKPTSTQALMLMVWTSFILTAHPAIAQESSHSRPKQICSITINSDDEIKTFQKHLSGRNFEFTELVTNERDWLKKACQSGIQCDVIVMSGHFGGSFFGSNGFLSLNEMEAASCDPGCNGIFHNSTEVYMYGCNTLAGKNKDRRTPQEYINVLRNDGYSLAEAQQIAAFLYSPFGEAFYARMSKVFSRVPRIYGFDGKAPLGPVVRPALSNYVKKMAPQFYQYVSNSSTDKNTVYASALAGTNATQIAGDFTETEYPACFLNNKNHSVTKKLEWIRDQIQEELSNNKFDTIPMAQHFYRGLKNKGYRFSSYEESIIDELSANSELKEAIGKLKLKLKMMPSVAFQLSDFEHWMQWLSDEEFHDIEIKTLLGEDSRHYSLETREFICSLDRPIDIRYDQIPQAFLKQSEFMWALACARPRDPKLVTLLSEYLTIGQQSSALIQIAKFLAEAKPQDPEIHWNLYRAYDLQTNPTVKWFMIHALRSIPATNPELLAILGDELVKARRNDFVTILGDALAKGQAQSVETQMKVVKVFLLTLKQPELYLGTLNNDFLPNSLSYVLAQLRPSHPTVRNAVQQILTTEVLTSVQRTNLNLALGQ